MKTVSHKVQPAQVYVIYILSFSCVSLILVHEKFVYIYTYLEKENNNNLIWYICAGHGKCDGKGSCHCDPGWLPSLCDVMAEDIDCIVSEWSNYSPCSATCGLAYRERTRKVIMEPRVCCFLPSLYTHTPYRQTLINVRWQKHNTHIYTLYARPL